MVFGPPGNRNLYEISAFMVDKFYFSTPFPPFSSWFCQKIPEFSEEKAMVHNVEQFVVMVLRLNFVAPLTLENPRFFNGKYIFIHGGFSDFPASHVSFRGVIFIPLMCRILPKTNMSSENRPYPKRKGSSSNYLCSGVNSLLVLWSVGDGLKCMKSHLLGKIRNHFDGYFLNRFETINKLCWEEFLFCPRGPVWKIESLNRYRNFFTFDGLCNMVFECPFCGYVFFFCVPFFVVSSHLFDSAFVVRMGTKGCDWSLQNCRGRIRPHKTNGWNQNKAPDRKGKTSTQTSAIF